MEIVKDVPMVSKRQSWPFRDMEVGDSFAVEHQLEMKARMAAAAYGRYHGVKFSTRKTPLGIRCWRIA